MGAGDPWVVVQHVAFEGPGSVARAITDSGAALTVVRIDRGEAVPPPAAVSHMGGLVVMGGPLGVSDDLPWLHEERALLHEAVTAGLPVLGVCLGAQQMAAALGAEVTRGPAPECGVG
jgi:GMP synthase (glutamine-hydrolysing)